MGTEKVFKVLFRADDGHLYSCMRQDVENLITRIRLSVLNRRFWVRYEKGKKSYPACSSLYLYGFKSYAHARRFRDRFLDMPDYHNLEVWECKAAVIEELPEIYDGLEFVESYWDFYKENGFYPSGSRPAPEGSVGCAWIELVERML